MVSVFRILLTVYQRVFCRRSLYALNRLMYQLALRGIGVLNYESPRLSGEREILRRVARLGRNVTVLDVGAHEGEYASEVARLMPGARVVAFEPHPDSFARLEAVAAGGRFRPVHAAVSDQHGTATLYDHGSATSGSQHASMVPGVFEKLYRSSNTRSWTVPCVVLDEFLRENGIEHVDLLKIDTEGHELQVLRGARAAIRAGTIDVIQLEFNSMNALSRVFMRDFRELLPGYGVYRLLPDGPVLLDGRDPILEEIFAFQNVLFVSDALATDVRGVITR